MNINFDNLNKYIEENYRPRKPRKINIAGILEGPNMDVCCASILNISLEDRIKKIDKPFNEVLFSYIDDLGLKDSDVYKKAYVSKQTFSKIRSDNDFKPSKDTVVCLCLALKLNIDNSLDLLKKCGYYLSLSSKRDVIIRYCIENSIFDPSEVDLIIRNYKLRKLVNFD